MAKRLLLDVFDWKASEDYNCHWNAARDSTELLRGTELSRMLRGTEENSMLVT